VLQGTSHLLSKASTCVAGNHKRRKVAINGHALKIIACIFMTAAVQMDINCTLYIRTAVQRRKLQDFIIIGNPPPPPPPRISELRLKQ
jgi:hypothetical protein